MRRKEKKKTGNFLEKGRRAHGTRIRSSYTQCHHTPHQHGGVESVLRMKYKSSTAREFTRRVRVRDKYLTARWYVPCHEPNPLPCANVYVWAYTKTLDKVSYLNVYTIKGFIAIFWPFILGVYPTNTYAYNTGITSILLYYFSFRYYQLYWRNPDTERILW